MVGSIILNPFTAPRKVVQSAVEKTESGGIDRNLPVDYDDGLEHDNDDGCVPDDPISDYLDE